MRLSHLLLLSLLTATRVAAAQAPTFTKNGWGPIRWTMSCDDAIAVLRSSGRTVTANEATGGFPRAGGGFDERRFVTVSWTEHGHETRMDCADYRVDGVTLMTRGLAGAQAASAGLAPLVAHYGPPAVDQPTPYGEMHGWVNATTRLRVTVSHIAGQWMSSECWTPADRPNGW